MRLAASFALSIVVLMTSSCDLSGCADIRQENESIYQQYLNLKEKRYKEWQKELANWEVLNQEEEARKQKEFNRCLKNPYEFYKRSGLKRMVDFFGGYESYKDKYGIQAVCETLQGVGKIYGARPVDDSADYPPAVLKYILSRTIIKNNPKCFSATEVAEAEQELNRLIPKS